MQTEVPGIFSCGNVLHVHDLVDYVSLESEVAGREAARFAAGSTPVPAAYTLVKDGFGVRGCVPQRIRDAGADEKVAISFRPADVYRNATWQIRVGENILLKRRAMILTPGESQRVELPREQFKGIPEVTVEVVMEEKK